MEKMNQVSVSEFFAKSNEEMYDMAVKMVENYNRLVDICNDSCERIATLVLERDNLSKSVQKLIGERDELIKRHAAYTDARNKDIAEKAIKIHLMEQEIDGRKKGYNALKKKMDTKYISIDEHNGLCKAYETRVEELEKQVKYLEKELDETCTCKELDLKGHNRREMALVNALADKNNEIKKLKETIDYYKNQERIRTDQLRATESKVDELWKEIEKLTKGEEDDYGKSGFKRYIEHLIEEEERAVPERFKERLNKEITEIFTKEEETVKYRPNEIDRFVNFLKDEVDKKHIVDIRYGVEDDLHVTRDLLVAAVKLIVAKGYHEYEGVTTDYGRFHVLTTPDVEFKDLYDTWKIKSIGPY